MAASKQYTGLTQKEAQERLIKYGKNTNEGEKFSWTKIALRQFKSSFIYLLIVAGGLSAALGERIDAIVITTFIAINASLGFIQEYRSEKTLEALKKFTQKKTLVLRDGQETNILSEDIVPGDVIILKSGDMLPADCEFIETNNVLIDESISTGESIPKEKNSVDNKIGLANTSVIKGFAKAIVTKTASQSSFGKIAQLATSAKRESNFEKGINTYSQVIIRLVGITLVVLFAAHLLIKGTSGQNLTQLILFSIALAVSVIPEALPVVITFSLSKGAAKLASHKVVVKRLSAIEDLGAINILCTDKTGTITENRLQVAQVYNPTNQLFAAAQKSLLPSVESGVFDPFDIAIKNGIEPLSSEEEKVDILEELPFDPKKRRSVLLIRQGTTPYIISKGAIESILSVCKIAQKEKVAAQKWARLEGSKGRRVLALAHKKLKAPLSSDIDSLEKDLEFLGLISFEDPLKPTAQNAIHHAQKLGIQIKMITGDSPDVAGVIGKEIHLINDENDVITGESFDSLKPSEQLRAVEKYHVFARINPEQKYKIIELLSKQNRVGFLGEGINDAAALKIASVGLVVQSASDISRQNADIILLQKSLNVIVDGVHEGREVFVNTTKYLKSTLASNFGNFFSVGLASLFIPFLPMLPLQILLVNLLSDFPMISVATDTVDPEETKLPQTYQIKKVMGLAIVLGIISSFFDFAVFGLFFKSSEKVLQTNWFIVSILTELVFIFIIRTRRFFLKSIRPSTTLVFLTSIAAFATVLIPYTKIGKEFFHFSPPGVQNIGLLAALLLAYIACSELAKLIYIKISK